MDSQFENLRRKSNLIRDAIMNKNITRCMLDDYMKDFNMLNKDAMQKLYSLHEPPYGDIYTVDDIDLMYLEHKLVD